MTIRDLIEPCCMRYLIPALLTVAATGAAADPLTLSVLDAERQLASHAQHAALRSAEPDTAERLDAQLKLLELYAADSKLPSPQRQKAEGVLRLLQAVRAEPRTLDGQPELPHLTVAVGDAGRSCAEAMPLDQGDARRVPIAAGESLWFRVQLPDAVNLGLSTRGSGIDAALTVHADCRTVDQAAMASADDNYGLQAELVVPAARQSYWVVRYENLSPVGGDAVLRASNSGILQGTVQTREGAPLPGTQPRINLFRRQSNFWSYQGSHSASSGSFSIPISQAGSYAARTDLSGQSQFLDQAFDDVLCTSSSFSLDGCNGGNVTEIPHNGVETRSIVFRLDRGIAITGVVQNLSGQPIPGASVELRTDSGRIAKVTADLVGRYRIEGNPPGTARLRAAAAQHRSTMYDNVPCPGFCSFPTGATPLPLTLGTTAYADFRLPAAPSLTVNVSLLNEQLSNLNSSLELSILRPNGSMVTTQSVSTWSAAITVSDLAPGDYVLRLMSANTVPRLYPDVECESDCISELAQAARVTLPDQPTTVVVDFRTRRYPMISGVVRDAGTGLPASGPTQMELLRLGSSSQQTLSLQTNGSYAFRGVPPGTYVLRAVSNTLQSTVHAGYLCESPLLANCNEFTPITVTRSSPDQAIDFSLTPLGRLAVTVNNAVSSNQALALVSPSGAIQREYFFSSTGSGTTTISGIGLGTRLIGLRGPSAVAQLFQGIDCPAGSGVDFANCPLAQATPVLIQSGQTGAVSFWQRGSNSRRVLVRGADTGAPLAGITLDLWDSGWSLVRSFTTGPDGSAWISNPFASAISGHFISTDNRRGYLDQVHAGIQCPNGPVYTGLCSLTGATPVILPAPDNNQPTIEILLQRETPLFRNGFEPSN
jgi:hypothetical protein